jgi:hypothetical protein
MKTTYNITSMDCLVQGSEKYYLWIGRIGCRFSVRPVYPASGKSGQGTISVADKT